MNEKLVSIIMPAYNAEDTIRESIKSVIEQTYKNWELIIIDDGSTDDTISIIKKQQKNDKRIKLLKNQKNLKVAKTRNRGLNYAKGDYIAFLDADDLWFKNKIEKQLNFMLKKNIDFSYSNIIIINDNEKRKKVIFDETVNYKKLLKGNQISCLTVMLKSTVIKSIKMKDIGHEDYLFWLEILKKNNLLAYNTNEVLAYYREGNKSLSSNKFQAAHWQWNIYRNELNLPLFSSMVNFIFYTVKGFLKHV